MNVYILNFRNNYDSKVCTKVVYLSHNHSFGDVEFSEICCDVKSQCFKEHGVVCKDDVIDRLINYYGFETLNICSVVDIC